MPASSTAAVPFAVHATASSALDAVLRWESRRAGVRIWSPARHAIGRMGFGANRFGAPAHFDPDSWWQQQVALGQAQSGYAGVEGLTTAFPTLSLGVADTSAWLLSNTGNAFTYTAMRQLTSATLLLQCFGKAQLYESLVEFFANHLNVANMTLAAVSTRNTSDREVTRANAFGTFRDMLQASARDIAMQIFLSLALSTASSLNENYGRELLELHTVTPAAGYSQAEVVDSARIMTGRFQDSNQMYKFNPWRHYVGPVRVLGFSSSNSPNTAGEQVGDDYLDYLAMHPGTAANLARKLCIRFVSDTPSTELIEAVAAAYLANDTAILPTVSTIFRSTEFWASHGAKVRRPSENIVASVRALGMLPSDNLTATGQALTDMCTQAGQVPLCWPFPDGYPDLASSWVSAGSTTALWGVHRDLCGGAYSDAFAPWNIARLAGRSAPADTGAAITNIARNLHGTPMPTAQRRALLTFLGKGTDSPSAWARSQTSSLVELTALMLHAPQHAHR